MNELDIDIKQAQDFLYNFDEDLNITFQLFDDTKQSSAARQYTGHFSKNFQEKETIQILKDANNAGCGIYFTINATDGKGRKENNITHIRALAVDLDGAPLAPVLECELSPHYVIESSRGRYQCYWLINPIPISSFSSIEEAKSKFATWQIALARKFGGDESIKDLSRVMRVPGFFHRKNGPQKSKVLEQSNQLHYEPDYIIGKLNLTEKVVAVDHELRQPLQQISEELKIGLGSRHLTLLKYACKYSHLFGLGEQERWWILKGLNEKACTEPVSDFDLTRINIQATRYAEDEAKKNDQVDISVLLDKHKIVTENPEQLMPDGMYDPPGLVGEVYRYIIDASIKPQPELALGAAFAACGALFGRKVRSETNLRTNLMLLALIETGGGKDWPRQAIKRLFSAAGVPIRASIESVTSDSSIVNSLCDCPSQVLLFDEFGRFMQTTNSRNAGTHEIAIPTVLMKLFSSANTTFHAKTYADKKLNKVIEQPNACMLATSVETNFYKHITKEAVDDGLLNRIIFLKSTNPDPAMREIKNFDPPESLVAAFQEWEAMPYRLDGGNLASVGSSAAPPMPRVVKYAEGAKEIFRDMESDLRVRRKDLRKEGLAGLFTRVFENSIKVALVLAAGHDRTLPRITTDHANYACTFIQATTNLMLGEVRKKVSDNRVEANHKAVLTTIRDSGTEGIATKELGDKLRRLGVDKRQRNEILQELESTGQIYSVSDKSTSTKGTTVYRFLRG